LGPQCLTEGLRAFLRKASLNAAVPKRTRTGADKPQNNTLNPPTLLAQAFPGLRLYGLSVRAAVSAVLAGLLLKKASLNAIRKKTPNRRTAFCSLQKGGWVSRLGLRVVPLRSASLNAVRAQAPLEKVRFPDARPSVLGRGVAGSPGWVCGSFLCVRPASTQSVLKPRSIWLMVTPFPGSGCGVSSFSRGALQAGCTPPLRRLAGPLGIEASCVHARLDRSMHACVASLGFLWLASGGALFGFRGVRFERVPAAAAACSHRSASCSWRFLAAFFQGVTISVRGRPRKTASRRNRRST